MASDEIVDQEAAKKAREARRRRMVQIADAELEIAKMSHTLQSWKTDLVTKSMEIESLNEKIDFQEAAISEKKAALEKLRQEA